MTAVVYVTGFGPFPGVEHNPTQAVASGLGGERFGDLEVVADVLPVSFARAPARVAQRVSELRPRLVLHLGVAAGSTTLRVERSAQPPWALPAPVVDVDGCAAGPAGPGGAGAVAALRTSLDAVALAAVLCEAGLPAVVSDDAGRYVCNATYHASLAAPAGPPCLFVHVPQLGALDPDGARWELSRLHRAARCVLEAALPEASPRV